MVGAVEFDLQGLRHAGFVGEAEFDGIDAPAAGDFQLAGAGEPIGSRALIAADAQHTRADHIVVVVGGGAAGDFEGGGVETADQAAGAEQGVGVEIMAHRQCAGGPQGDFTGREAAGPIPLESPSRPTGPDGDLLADLELAGFAKPVGPIARAGANRQIA